MVILVGLTAKRAFRFLVNVFGFILDNLDPVNLFPLKEPMNRTLQEIMIYFQICLLFQGVFIDNKIFVVVVHTWAKIDN